MTRKDVAKLFIRFLITFAFMLVVLIPLGIFLENKVSDFVMIFIFVVVAGGGFAIEEYIHFKSYAKRQRLKEEALKQEELKAGETRKQKKQKGERNGK